MVIHPVLPASLYKNGHFSKLKIEYFKDLFMVVCEIKQKNIKNKGLFLFDTGYDRTLMLDNEILNQKKFPTGKMEILKKVVMKGAQGNEIPVTTSNLEQFKIGKFKLNNVPAQLLTTNKPIKDKNIHILGNEILKRFNIFLDFQSSFIYLSPNCLFNESYIEKKKNDS